MAYVLAKFVFKLEVTKDRNICVSIEYREKEIVVLRGWIHQRMKPLALIELLASLSY